MKKIYKFSDLSKNQRKVLITFARTGYACTDAMKKNNRYYYPGLMSLLKNGLVREIAVNQFVLTYDGQKILGEIKIEEDEVWKRSLFDFHWF